MKGDLPDCTNYMMWDVWKVNEWAVNIIYWGYMTLLVREKKVMLFGKCKIGYTDFSNWLKWELYRIYCQWKNIAFFTDKSRLGSKIVSEEYGRKWDDLTAAWLMSLLTGSTKRKGIQIKMKVWLKLVDNSLKISAVKERFEKITYCR